MSQAAESQDIETATTAVVTDGAPDGKARRYDRQLRLWAATGQAALENSRILVVSGSATSTSILKNLVLPGIGHFTILDHNQVTPEDAGNNFFLEGPSSIGKSRAEESVRLLGELNDSVEGVPDKANIKELLETNPAYFSNYTVLIAHNLEATLLEKLSKLLWSDPSYPILVVIRSAGFLGEFYIQFHEHTIIESHSDSPPSLRIDKPFPALLEHALSLDLSAMDPTDHGHVPYVVILVKVLEDWKKSHDGAFPKTPAEKKEFKANILALKVKIDEENFDEAEAQAYKAWSTTTVPSEISSLFNDPGLSSLSPSSPPFFHLLAALQKFAAQPPHTLPLTSTLPDMKADTTSYIHLQNLYKTRAEEEKKQLREYLTVPVDDAIVDSFVKNAHALKVMRGKRWGWIDEDPAAFAEKLVTEPKQATIHLALSALAVLQTKEPGIAPTIEKLTEAAQSLLPPGTILPEDEWAQAVGEIARSPDADLPNTAAFTGGLVAQEVIKMITKQYVPIDGHCIFDLVETWTGIL